MNLSCMLTTNDELNDSATLMERKKKKTWLLWKETEETLFTSTFIEFQSKGKNPENQSFLNVNQVLWGFKTDNVAFLHYSIHFYDLLLKDQ